ncbi:MAG: HNH endonuclease [Saprospiraceae bacterium]|nr:HNH endonuclease [Saprospiraceae bacterium]
MPAIPSLLKREVEERAFGRCEYCMSQNRFSPDPFSVEHIIPLSRKGLSQSDNLAYACQGCNNRKYNAIEAIDPLNGKATPLFHPRQHIWGEHFTWNDDYTLVIGLTAIGRATIERLKMNRIGLINLRKILHSCGEHP